MNRMTPDVAVKNLGIKDGKLNPCPDMKNCVCSQHKDKFSVDPINMKGPNQIDKIAEVVGKLKGFTIAKKEGSYLHATFKSTLMGFIDDIEFLVSGDQVHVRSASRLGYWDIGANQKRVEMLRKKLQD